MMSSRQHRLDKKPPFSNERSIHRNLNQKYNKMIGKKIILEVVDIVSEITGGDKNTLKKSSPAKLTDGDKQLRYILYFILRYEFGFQPGLITETLGIPSHTMSRNGNSSLIEKRNLEKVMDRINKNGLLNKK